MGWRERGCEREGEREWDRERERVWERGRERGSGREVCGMAAVTG